MSNDCEPPGNGCCPEGSRYIWLLPVVTCFADSRNPTKGPASAYIRLNTSFSYVLLNIAKARRSLFGELQFRQPRRRKSNIAERPMGCVLPMQPSGMGPPQIKSASKLNTHEYDWESPIWHHLLEGLAKRNHTLVRYDARGNGGQIGMSMSPTLDASGQRFGNRGRCNWDKALSAGISQRLRHFRCCYCAASRAPYTLHDPVWWLCAGRLQAITSGVRKAKGDGNFDAHLFGAWMIRHSGKCSPRSSFRRLLRNRLIGSTTFNGRLHHLKWRLATLKS